jgi:O-antigen/teichoic acid export membrane protein
MTNALTTILISLVCRAVQVASSLLVVRYLVGILGITHYGTWVTMTAAIVWMSLFDFGVGYGIKNRIAELSAIGQSTDLRSVASVALIFYGMATALVSIAFVTIAFFVAPFSEKPMASIILFAGASVSFFMSLGGIVLQGIGAFRSFYALSLVGPVIWSSLVLLNRDSNWTVLQASSFFVAANTIQAVATLAIGLYRAGGVVQIPIAICIKEIKSMIGVGAGFLVSQISNITLFMSGNFIIYRYLGSAEAAIYDTTNKFFQFFIIGFSIIINIAWTKISQGKALQNFIATKRVYQGLLWMSLFAGIGACFFALMSGQVVALLTRGTIHVDVETAAMFVPLIFVQTFAYSGAVFLNAYQELRVQNILSIATVPIFLGIVHILFALGVRIGAVPIASAIAVSPAMIYCLRRGYALASYGKVSPT